MMSPEEAVQTRKRNYRTLSELKFLSYTLGVNLDAPTPSKNLLRIWNVILVVSSTLSLYSHWCEFERNLDNIPRLAETISTALQTMISLFKMVYFLFYQDEIYELLEVAQKHQLLQEIEIFQHDFEGKEQLREKINAIMKPIWRNIRRQFVFYTICCVTIGGNYVVRSIVRNTYHKIKQTPDYEFSLAYPAFYAVWADKGMASPYYEIQMFLNITAVYISGICAITFDIVFVTLCLHSVGLVKVLNMLIEQSTSSLVPRERRVEYLRYCIYHYQRADGYILKIHEIFKHISLSQFFLSLLILGFVLFEMNFGLESDTTVLIRMMMYISACGTQIIMYCANAQQLSSISEEIPNAFYCCEWYNESREFKELIFMMILRTNKHFEFQVSWFSTMSLATLISLFNMSGSYFLLLRSFEDE